VPEAQNWIADFYFNPPREDFVNAEKNYQELFQKFPAATNFALHARLMAGRAAFAYDITEARKYFSDPELIGNTNAPADIVAETYFALGDTIFQQFLLSSNATSFREALAALSKITNGSTTNTLAPLAMGRIGDYWVQWALLETDPDSYTNAIHAYESVLQMPQAGISARSQAEVGLGRLAKLQGNLKEAREHFDHVLYDNDSEQFDPFWLKEAAVAAARLCEDSNDWEGAKHVYERVLKSLPSLQSTLNKKIQAAQAHLDKKESLP
jgi:tetratricopeptide (TPR) repeat protein